MNYCAVTEAFDNSLKQKINEYDKNNINNNNNNNNNNNKLPHTNDIVAPDAFDNYSDIDIQHHFNNNINQYQTMVPAFFTTQGDYSTKGPYFGTTINDLQNNTGNDSDNLSLFDSNSSEESIISKKLPKKINHDYCINKIVKDLLDDPDTVSLASSQNDEAYKHVKICKYCKTRINQRMSEHFNPNQISEPKQIKPIENIKEYFDVGNLGYDLKELLIIVLAGIILIFILDLLVKIGKRMNK